jgi:predicted nuclease of restriction endonuclease-like RecB superfamily
MNNKIKNNSVNNYNRVKRGFIEIGGKKFFARSSWEANIAAYLEFLKTNLEIKEWQHEPETFWFEKIKRGVRSYLPDFKITKNDETIYFLEVKGWMDDKSKTKIKRMALYYPNVTLDIIDQKRYKDIKRSSSVIKNWGLLDSDEFLNKIKVCSVEGCELKNFCKNYCRKHYYENTKVVFKKN